MPVKFDNRIVAARLFGELLHMDKLYGKHPYSYHLHEVFDTLCLRFHVTDKDMLAASFLHDAQEDTGVTRDTVKDLFGERVAELVDAVSDPPGYKSRKERKAAAYPRIKAVPGATQLKLADRIANVEHSINAHNGPMFKMYQGEQPGFESALRVIGEHDDMWRHLEHLMVEGAHQFVPKTKVVEPEL
jgi:guanosine-3',5'-bis(diphosphate) 3'-pyrophosphohydrolase